MSDSESFSPVSEEEAGEEEEVEEKANEEEDEASEDEEEDEASVKGEESGRTSPPPQPPTPEHDSQITTFDLVPGEENPYMAPSKFFGPFETYVHEFLTELQENVNARETEATEHMTNLVVDSHKLTMSSLEHIMMLVNSQLMDFHYLTRPPDEYSYNDVMYCTYKEPKEDTIEAFIRTVNTVIKEESRVTRSNIFKCKEHANLHELAKRNTKMEGVYIIVSCVHDHYKVENMSHISIIMKMRMVIEGDYEKDEDDRYVFMYAVKNGF